MNESINQVIHVPSTAWPDGMSMTIEHKKHKPIPKPTQPPHPRTSKLRGRVNPKTLTRERLRKSLLPAVSLPAKHWRSIGGAPNQSKHIKYLPCIAPKYVG